MSNSTLPTHWQFALGQAFAGLRELVYAFDFARFANGHTFAGVEPRLFIDVIDGFLGEPDGIVFGGDRAQLRQLRSLLVERILPAHQQGLAVGRRCWHEGDHVLGAIVTEALHELALRSAPDDVLVRGWFAEGFCYAYTFEEMDSLRKP